MTPSPQEFVRPTLPDLPTFARGPFRLDPICATIYGTDEFGGSCKVADIRGWGYLTGRGQALALSSDAAIEAQRKTGEWIVAAMNRAWQELTDTPTTERTPTS